MSKWDHKGSLKEAKREVAEWVKNRDEKQAEIENSMLRAEAQLTPYGFLRDSYKDDASENDQDAAKEPEDSDLCAKAGASPEDKLRLIRDTVEGQAPFGSDLANFQRRLRLILDMA